MGPISSPPSTIFSNTLLPKPFPLISHSKLLCNKAHTHLCKKPTYEMVHFSDHFIKNRSSPFLVASASSGSAESNQGDRRAMETVLRLYSMIKNKNIKELSDIIGEECHCICNFVSSFQPFHGKKQVMEFFSSLMKNLGNNFEFIIQPTLHDGMTVGVSWRLESSKTHVPLGTGFSIYTCHVYEGRVVIRNVEMFMEPVLHIEPLRLKMFGFVMNLMGKMASQAWFKGKRKKAAYILCSILLIVALLFYLRLCWS